MMSSLRVLEIKSCPALEVFDLFQKGHNYTTEHKPWLPSLRKLIICDCPHLQPQIPLPPSATFSELLISGVSTIMTMEGSSMENFKISGDTLLRDTVDDKILAFHNLKDIKYLEILWCKNLTSISFKGLSQLISLKSLKIEYCTELFSLDFVAEHTHEDMITVKDAALPSLESLYIKECGMTGKGLSLMLRHSSTLKELDLIGCPQLKQLKIEEEEKVPASWTSRYLCDASSGYADDTRPSIAVDELVHIPLNLRKITIGGCPHLIFDGSREGLAGITILGEEVEEEGQENGRCLLPQSLEQLVWYDYSQKTLRPCFVGNLPCLKKLEVNSGSLEYLQLDSCTALEDLEIRLCEQLVALQGMQSLGTLRSLVLCKNSRFESLQLHSCTALECLEIHQCRSLVSLEGLQSLVNLKHLIIVKSPTLDYFSIMESYEPVEGISSHSCELFPALESLETDNLSTLNMSFCKGLTCLRSLRLTHSDATRLTDEQEKALLLLGSLQELQFKHFWHLVYLPTGLRSLPSLKSLEIIFCNSISGLLKEGLPPSLEKLEIYNCSAELSEGCRLLATNKLEVEIDGDYVD
ncbi:unnamed protein product [Triticum turgidum subsp. durum]|uniref:Uncharacterized protein n=1 Tax=Triticum turgidum subsp. durum TaxID=4567 RepID=A0A9R0YAR6_TRITD|nr:unnamed protein product [Triticum turgidum subsp. durum]